MFQPSNGCVGRRFLARRGNWQNEIVEFLALPITNAYTECQNGLIRARDRRGLGYSFEALRVKLLRAPKKSGVVTIYRSIETREKSTTDGMGRCVWMVADLDDEYETVKVPERKEVTWGVEIARLADGLERYLTGQKRLPAVA